YVARDAAELVEVDYEPLPAVADPAKALERGAPAVHDEAPDNVCFRWQLGDKAATDKAFSGAAKVVKQSFRNHRLIPNAIEPRSALASANPGTGEVTLWVTSQNPHVHRLIMAAFVLGLPEHKLRVISPDVGGRPHPRAAGEDGGEHGRLSFAVRALHPDVSLRHAARGRLPDTHNPRRSDRRVHAHHTGGRVSRRGAPGGHLPAGADGGPVRGRAGNGSAGDPPQEFHSQ